MPRAGSSEPVPYDFRRPNKFNRDHQRALAIASETFARHFTTTLSSTLRSVTSVQVAHVGQMTYDEYIREVPNPSYLAVLSMAPLTGSSLLHIPLALVMTIVDRMLGGAGTGMLPDRPLTDIEGGLIKGMVARILRELAYAFESLSPIDPQLLHQESNPQFAQVAAATDMVVLITFELKIGERQGEASLCIPFSSLQPVLDEVTANAFDSNRVTADPYAMRQALSGQMADAAVEVRVRFEEVTLATGEIVALRPGDIVPLHHRIDRPLAVTVGGVRRFAAVGGRKGKRLACVVVDPDAVRDH